jgi:small-conductance mechanosensitive channel
MDINWDKIKDFFDYPIIGSKDTSGFHLNTLMIIFAILAVVFTTFILRGLKKVITRKMEATEKMKFDSAFKFFNYLVYIIVIISVLSSSGLQLTGVLTASAALFVGLGFALQDLFKDIIAGVTILIDRSVLVNDVIEMNDRVGRVFEVKLRSTRIVTRDDKILIIPNHLFMTMSVYNYTQNHPKTRESVSVGVAYGSDTELVSKLLLEAANQQSGVLKSPAPFVMFNNFGDSSLDFAVYYFVLDAFTEPRIKSAMRFAIDKAFRENGVVIPFPQRDLHVISGSTLSVKTKEKDVE